MLALCKGGLPFTNDETAERADCTDVRLYSKKAHTCFNTNDVSIAVWQNFPQNDTWKGRIKLDSQDMLFFPIQDYMGIIRFTMHHAESVIEIYEYSR